MAGYFALRSDFVDYSALAAFGIAAVGCGAPEVCLRVECGDVGSGSVRRGIEAMQHVVVASGVEREDGSGGVVGGAVKGAVAGPDQAAATEVDAVAAKRIQIGRASCRE